MRKYSFAAAAALCLAVASPATAQIFTPTFTSPRLLNEVGVAVSDGPGDLALEGIWRGGPLGLRVGFVDAHDGLLSISGEMRSPLPMAGAPVGLAFTAAAQGLIGDVNAAGVQGGLTAGYTFMGSGMAFTPYLHPRIGMVRPLGRNRDWGLEVLADVGADLEFYNNLVLRLGVNLGDVGSGWGVALGWRR
jgi:hypothetical protein